MTKNTEHCSTNMASDGKVTPCTYTTTFLSSNVLQTPSGASSKTYGTKSPTTCCRELNTPTGYINMEMSVAKLLLSAFVSLQIVTSLTHNTNIQLHRLVTFNVAPLTTFLHDNSDMDFFLNGITDSFHLLSLNSIFMGATVTGSTIAVHTRSNGYPINFKIVNVTGKGNFRGTKHWYPSTKETRQLGIITQITLHWTLN